MTSGTPASKFEHPPLTPQFCFSTRTLKDFLRRSRSAIDDTISQNLNALSQPSRSPFSPSAPSPSLRPSQHTLAASACTSFTHGILFPSWQSRSDVLNYCASVATSADPDDPDSLARLEEDMEKRERVVDERLDPYSGRYFPRETRTEELAGVVRNERAVEEIVRERTWRIVGERCEWGVGQETEWRRAMEGWRKGGRK